MRSAVSSRARRSIRLTARLLGPLTVDSRTLTTNYNVADNATGAQELWLRSGFEWTPLNNVTIKNQVYYYEAKRNWIDSETYAFNNGTRLRRMIDRDRFFVTHNQHVVGDNTDFTWDSQIFRHGQSLRRSAPVEQELDHVRAKGRRRTYPYDSVTVVDPVPGLYGPESPSISETVGSPISPDHSKTVSRSRRRSR